MSENETKSLLAIEEKENQKQRNLVFSNNQKKINTLNSEIFDFNLTPNSGVTACGEGNIRATSVKQEPTRRKSL